MTENVRIDGSGAEEQEPSGAGTDDEIASPSGIPDGFLRVSPRRLLQDWEAAHLRALGYVRALALPQEDHAALADEAIRRALAQAWDEDSDAVAETMQAVRHIVQERYRGVRLATASDFVACRIERAVSHAGPSSAAF